MATARLAVITTTMLLALSAVNGSIVELSTVPADSRWLIHMDMAAARDSALGKSFIESQERKSCGLDDSAKRITQQFGIDPLTGVESYTVVGSEFSRESAVVYARGDIKEADLQPKLASISGYVKETHGAHTLHTCPSSATIPFVHDSLSIPLLGAQNKHRSRLLRPGSSTATFAFVDNSLLLISLQTASVKNALDVLDGKVAGAKTGEDATFPGWNESTTAAPFVLAFTNSEDMKSIFPHAILSKIRHGIMTLSTPENEVALDVQVEANDPESSQALQQAVTGYLALAMLAEREQPVLARIAKGTRVKSDSLDVHLAGRWPVAAVMGLSQFIKFQYGQGHQCPASRL